MKTITHIIYVLSVIASIFAGNLRTRIHGGSDAADGNFPYHVYLTTPRGTGAYCGGSIIDKRWVLTAAHCFDKENIQNILMQVGTIYRSGQGGAIYYVEKQIVHEHFKGKNSGYDIALLRTDRDIEFNSKVQPIQLADRNTYVGDNEKATFTGFGQMEGRKRPKKLQTVSLNMYGYRKCNEIKGRIKKSQICTLPAEKKGPCIGDSGGPLVNENGVQVGIDSLAYGACTEVPEIYVQVSYFREWIDNNIK